MQRVSEKPFKEKYVSICEDIFCGRSPIQSARDRGIQGRTALTRFWDELLLLKVNQEFLAQCISNRTEDELRHVLKPIINEVFAACVTYLSDENYIRVAHALETLAILSREIFKKRFSQQGVSITLLLAGSADNADAFFKRLISSVGTLLSSDIVPVLVKSLGLRLCLTILTATDNVNSNPITSYFISNSILDPLVSSLSLKLTADRKRLELDAVMVLLLLLLWRESENVYISRLASPTAPLQPLLNAVISLVSASPAGSKVTTLPSTTSSAGWEWESMVGYVSNWLGFAAMGEQNSTDANSDSIGMEGCINNNTRASCGLMLLYFLFYHNPAFKSNQTWPAVDAHDQGSLATLWITVFKTFMLLCKTEILAATMSSTERTLNAKLALTILRCIMEAPVAVDYLLHCDSTDFSLKTLAMGNTVIAFRSLACFIVDEAATVLTETSIDPDLMFRAAVLIPLALRAVKRQGWQLSPSSMNTTALWQALVDCCGRCGNLSVFQKPGGAEAAELVSGTLEWCLAVSQEILAAPEDTEALHATVMCNIDALEKLMETAASAVNSTSTNKNWSQLVNVTAVKHHYEVKIAALGIFNKPNFQQALTGVKKQGVTNLKLRPKHAGPGRLYIEGTSELRMLNSLVRLLVNVQRKRLLVLPKLEHEAI